MKVWRTGSECCFRVWYQLDIQRKEHVSCVTWIMVRMLRIMCSVNLMNLGAHKLRAGRDTVKKMGSGKHMRIILEKLVECKGPSIGRQGKKIF